MFTALEDLDAVVGVTRCVGCHKDGFDRIVLDQLFERFIRLFATAVRGQPGTTIREQVADRDDLDVRVILKTKCGAKMAKAVTDDPDPNLTVGLRFPYGTFINIGFGLVKAGDRFFLGGQRTAGGNIPAPMAVRVKKERRERLLMVLLQILYHETCPMYVSARYGWFQSRESSHRSSATRAAVNRRWLAAASSGSRTRRNALSAYVSIS